MAWQDVFPVSSPRIDAEEDREMRLAMQARAGAEWALTALIARYQPPVTRYLTRLTGNSARARVLAERIFLRMERRIHGPHGGRYLRLWLLRSCTEDGLDALRKPRRFAPAPRLGAPLRPLALLNAPGVAPHIERLRAGLGALASVTSQTSRQARKLIWPDRDHEAGPKGASDGPPDAFADDAEDGGEPDARESLRYRMIRAILAELPYGDAQCLALHLVAGLNQAEVAQALGLTNSATRRRIVLGLQLFAQRYDSAVAALGLSPDMLSAVRPDARIDPLTPGIGGYVAYQEQPTNAYPAVSVSPEPPAAEPDLLEAVAAGPTDWLPRDDAASHMPPSFGVRSGSVLEGTIVESMPAHAETADAHPLILAEAIVNTQDTTPLPQQEHEQANANARSWAVSTEAAGGQAWRFGDDKPTLPRLTSIRPRSTGDLDDGRTVVDSMPPAPQTPAAQTPVVPVLSPPAPRQRERAETPPLSGKDRSFADLSPDESADARPHAE